MSTLDTSYFEHDADIGIIGRGVTVEQAFEAAAQTVFAIVTPVYFMSPKRGNLRVWSGAFLVARTLSHGRSTGYYWQQHRDGFIHSCRLQWKSCIRRLGSWCASCYESASGSKALARTRHANQRTCTSGNFDSNALNARCS